MHLNIPEAGRLPGGGVCAGTPVSACRDTESGMGAPGTVMGMKQWKELEAACQCQDWRKHSNDLPRLKDTIKSREQSCVCIYGGEDKKA